MSQESKILLELQIKFNALALKAADELYHILQNASDIFPYRHPEASRIWHEGDVVLESVRNLIENNFTIGLHTMDARMTADTIDALPQP